MRMLRSLALVLAGILAPAAWAANDPAGPAEAASAPAVSLSARKVYEQARSQLLQIRTVLKGRASQTSVGSGFIVSKEGHIVTNFHVVSEVALEPGTHDLVYVTADGREAPLTILMLDVLHDLALLKIAPSKDAPPHLDALGFRPANLTLAQGERMYSLGNPLDVGFAVIEGNYNGLVERSFYPQIFFSGSLSAGMSGGPALDQEGRVIGVNVARRVDGEQVSFLVPGAFAAALLERGRNAPPMKGPAHAEITRQLTEHQALLTERFVSQGWKTATHTRYKVPVPPDRFMRCWGSTEQSRTGGLDFERSDCVMDTRIFVGQYTTGAISVRHESYDGSKLGTLRFASRYSQSFRNESFRRLRGDQMTKPQCHENFVQREGLPLRAVVCLRAYKKLPQLYDVAVLVATLDQNQGGVQGRFDAQGFSFANAIKLSQHYLEGYGLHTP
ncbi:serine protease [Piscinibacter sp. XHJ-5]|uniref:S1 family peptidase n=1 Tax=Piscinibacter sp. XHJ-5 TaxID=3037797 RepID=UPI0024529CA5|nr:serine protease [Piscinibacter sp. XHJ-5]